MKCFYCNNEAKLTSGEEVYPNRPDLSRLPFWLCIPCDAYVGCHKGTTTPLGTMANRELRLERVKAHRAFDAIWKDGSISRTDAYAWLSHKLDIKKKNCHIGSFNIEMCSKTIAVCKQYHPCEVEE